MSIIIEPLSGLNPPANHGGTSVTIQLTADDVANTRFGYSAVWETTASLSTLTSPSAYALHRPLRRGLSAAGRTTVRRLIDLTNAMRWIPHSLSPQPCSLPRDPLTEFAAIRATDPDLVEADLELLRRDRPDGPWTAMDGAQFIDELATRLADYWSIELAPHWEAIVSVNQLDAQTRARALAREGVGSALSQLHPSVSYAASTLTITMAPQACERSSGGQGLWLIPSVFRWPKVALSSGGAGPLILSYPAQGSGTIWDPRSHADHGLEAVLGRSRAAVLAELRIPRTTTWLARRLDLAPATVSAHLSALSMSRLVVRSREGRLVMYRRTSLGTQLVQGVQDIDHMS